MYHIHQSRRIVTAIFVSTYTIIYILTLNVNCTQRKLVMHHTVAASLAPPMMDRKMHGYI